MSLDLTMPGSMGFSSLLLRGERPEAPLIGISSSDPAHTARRAQQSGASGLVSWAALPEVLREVMSAVMAGGASFSDVGIARKERQDTMLASSHTENGP